MPTPNLPSANSIVDFLKTSGQDSSFTARRKLYTNSGFDKRLGDYVGSASQNINLLKNLQTKTTPATDTVSTIQKSPIVNANQKEAFSMSPINLTGGMGGVQTTTPAMATLNRAGYAEFKPAPLGTVTGKDLPEAVSNFNAQAAAKLGRTASPTETAPVAPTPTVTATPQQADTNTQKTTGGVSASTLYPDVFTQSDPGEADVVNSWINSSEGQLFLEKQKLAGMNAEAIADSAKAELEAKYKQEVDTLTESLAANGLAFSGIRGSKVKALADSLAASTLEVDREFASKLLDANLDLRDAILKGVGELAKRAKEKDDDAIKQLNAIGYAVIGNQLVPTLAARSAERADVQLQISEARLNLAEQAAARAEARFSEEFGVGRSDQFDYVKELMDLNPNATREELKVAALQNTRLSSTEIDSVLDTIGLTSSASTETAKALVAMNFTAKLLSSRGGELEAAKEAAKQTIRSTGGVLKVGGRTVTLSAEQLVELESYIDTVTADEALKTKELLKK